MNRRMFCSSAGLMILTGCVPNVPLPANVVVDIQKTCAWVPTVKVGVEIAVSFLPGAAAVAVNAAMDYLSNLCDAPPADLGGVAQKVVDAIQTVESALTKAKASMSRLGARRGAGSDYQKVLDALAAIQQAKKLGLRHF